MRVRTLNVSSVWPAGWVRARTASSTDRASKVPGLLSRIALKAATMIRPSGRALIMMVVGLGTWGLLFCPVRGGDHRGSAMSAVPLTVPLPPPLRPPLVPAGGVVSLK